jgi:hypothetical protein
MVSENNIGKDLSLEELIEKVIESKHDSYRILKSAARRSADLKVREELVQHVIDERVQREDLKKILEEIKSQRELEDGMAG